MEILIKCTNLVRTLNITLRVFYFEYSIVYSAYSYVSKFIYLFTSLNGKSPLRKENVRKKNDND